MAACDIATLLNDGRCFHGLSDRMLNVAIAQLWCSAAEALANMESPNPAIQSIDDGEWYRVIGIEISPGNALLWMSQVVTSPGVNASLVIADPDTGDKYEIEAWGTPGVGGGVQYQVQPIPTLDPETPTVITVGSTQYNLLIRQSPDPTAVLEPV